MAAFVALSLDHLTVFPPVGDDEPWIAAAPHKLATQGVYGSDLFAGYYGVERHNYQHMPVYPLMQAALFKTLGVGVFQMRLLPVLFGAALLLATFLVGQRIGDARVGAIAVLLALVHRVAAGGDATGILLLDRARINRYDIAVPVFGLLAFWALLRGHHVSHLRWHLLAGVLAALASLSHLFGAFWLPVLLGLSLQRGASRLPRRQTATVVFVGFLLPWLPWLGYLASGWPDFLGQMRFVSPRFDLLNPSFYLHNVMHGDGPISIGWLVHAIANMPWHRPGAWSAIAGIPIAAAVMVFSAGREGDRGRPARMLALAALAQVAMFLALLQVKTINYMIGLWPLALLMLSWLGVWLWDRRKTTWRGALVGLVLLILGEGIAGITQSRAAARLALPYEGHLGEIARCIPEGSRVLGLPRFWLGLRHYEYRTWVMAANFAHATYYHAPMPLQTALEIIDPDVILIDRDMAAFFQAAAASDHPYHALQTGFATFAATRGAESICAIHNPTYGTMQVYRVPERPTP